MSANWQWVVEGGSVRRRLANGQVDSRSVSDTEVAQWLSEGNMPAAADPLSLAEKIAAVENGFPIPANAVRALILGETPDPAIVEAARRTEAEIAALKTAGND